MKDHVTALIEALRLVNLELDKLCSEKQGPHTTIRAIQMIVREPHVVQAVQGLEPFVESPEIAPLRVAVRNYQKRVRQRT